MAARNWVAPETTMGIGFRELLIILVIALILFGAKKLRNVGTDLGAAVRGFKKAVNEGDSDQTKQLQDLGGKDADFEERAREESKPDTKSNA
jgi:sec-independent protein translocase protein TatA